MDIWILYHGHIEIYRMTGLTLVDVVSVAVWRVLSHSRTFLFLLQC